MFLLSFANVFICYITYFELFSIFFRKAYRILCYKNKKTDNYLPVSYLILSAALTSCSSAFIARRAIRLNISATAGKAAPTLGAKDSEVTSIEPPHNFASTA